MIQQSRQLRSTVSSTFGLIADISETINTLSRAQDSCSVAISRLEDASNIKVHLESLENALKGENWLEGALAVQAWRKLSVSVVEPSALRALKEKTEVLVEAVRKECEQLLSLLGNVTESSAEAESDNQASLENRCWDLIALFPIMSLEDEGITLLQRLVSARLNMMLTALHEAKKKRLLEQGGQGMRAALVSLEGVCLVLSQVSSIIDKRWGWIVDNWGQDYVGPWLLSMQDVVDNLGTFQVKKWQQYHGMKQERQQAGRQGGGVKDGAALGEDPRDADAVCTQLANVLSVHFLWMYNMRASYNEAVADSRLRQEVVPAFPEHASLSLCMEELEAGFLQAEDIALRLGMSLCISNNEILSNAEAGTLVDEVFFLLDKSARRAINAGSAHVASRCLALLSELLLETYLPALRQVWRGASVDEDSSMTGGMSGRKARVMAVNNVYVSLRYVKKFRGVIESLLQEHALHPHESSSTHANAPVSLGPTFTADVPKWDVTRPLHTLKTFDRVVDSLNMLADELLSLLYARLRPKLMELLQAQQNMQYALSELDYADNEITDPFAANFVREVAAGLKFYENKLATEASEAFVGKVLQEVVHQMMETAQKKRFSQLGALQFDKDIRCVMTFFAQKEGQNVREAFARLAQMANVLNVEKPGEILDYWGPGNGVAWRLSASEVKSILKLRMESAFAAEGVEALPLV